MKIRDVRAGISNLSGLCPRPTTAPAAASSNLPYGRCCVPSRVLPVRAMCHWHAQSGSALARAQATTRMAMKCSAIACVRMRQHCAAQSTSQVCCGPNACKLRLHRAGSDTKCGTHPDRSGHSQTQLPLPQAGARMLQAHHRCLQFSHVKEASEHFA